MNTRRALVSILLTALVASIAIASYSVMQIKPPANEPKIVNPGPPGGPPSDAIVLFDGKDLSQWRSFRPGGGDAKWLVKDGFMQVVAGTGDIGTKQTFEDVQLHIEWATPSEVKGTGQERGNSGVFLQERYELQVLDSFNNKTYFHGQAAGIYKQHAPLVNASRGPGEWQVYDIIYHAPKFDEAGNVVVKARMTALHNGVLVQDHSEIFGTTTHEDVQPSYTKHGAASIKLQDHGNPVRYRNIWLRKL
jgi:3-keto-disaccharide hydrolase